MGAENGERAGALKLQNAGLLHWLVAFLAAGWALLQGVGYLGDALGWGPGVVQTLSAVLGAGWLAALAHVWRNADRWKPMVGGAELLIFAVLSVVLGTFVAQARDRKLIAALDAAPASLLPDDIRTIAVLPLASPRGDAELESWAAEIDDYVRSRLATFRGMQVTSGVSTERYRDTDKEVRRVAEELRVRTVLRGKVERLGGRLGLTVALVDAGGGAHLWAQRYDRALTQESVRAIQTDILERVAEALGARPPSGEPAAVGSPGQRDLEAVSHFRRGRDMFDRRSLSGGGQPESAALFERAVELDPGYAEAWSYLARARAWLVRTGITTDTAPARRALERAIALAPSAPETDLAQGYYRYHTQLDFPGALRHLRAAERARPQDLQVLLALASVLRRLGRLEEADGYLDRALRLDPQNPDQLTAVAYMRFEQDRFDEAERLLDRALAAEPGYADAALRKFELLLWAKGDTTRAAELARSAHVRSDAHRVAMVAQLAIVRRDYSTALAALSGSPAGAASQQDPLPALERLWLLGWLEHEIGRPARAAVYADSLELAALATLGRPLPTSSDAWGVRGRAHAYLGSAHALRGERSRALDERERALALYPLDRDAVDGDDVEELVARLEVLAGDYHNATQRLTRLLAVPSDVKVARLRLDPLFDPLRESRDFRELMTED